MANTTTCLSQDTGGKKKTKPTTTIKFPTYGCKLVIVIVDSVAKAADKLYKKYKIEEEFGGEAEGALVILEGINYYLLLDEKYLSHNTIAHEVFHAAVRITEDRDITDEESQAWVAGHISGVIYKFLEKKKFTIKHG